MHLLATLALSTQVTLTLAPAAEVSGTEIMLEDVAVLEGPAEVVEQLAQSTLGFSPAPGHSRLLQGWRLEQILERDNSGLDVVLAGSPTCRVQPRTTLIEADEIERVARELLTPSLQTVDAQASLRAALQDVRVPAGKTTPQLRPGTLSVDLRGDNVSVPVRIDVDGAPYKTVWTQWVIERFEVVPVLVQDVPAGVSLTLSMIENRRMPVSRSRAQSKALPAGLALGGITVRSMAGGSVVTEEDLHRPKIIFRGDRIYLTIRKGPVTAKVPAIAREDGSIGQRIRVSSMSSERELMAVVAGRDVVQLDLTVGS